MSATHTHTPERDDWLLDLALLAALSVAVHALLGLYGLAGALLLFAGLEHGPARLSRAPYSPHTAVSKPPASTVPSSDLAPENAAPEAAEPPVDALQLLRARRRLARLSVRDVGRRLSPPRPQSAPERAPDVEMNACAPVRFETALFSGQALFLVRSAPEDPRHAALLAGKRRLFWIQVQGRFKYAPRGAVFLGGELPTAVSPGVWTRSLARVILGLVRRLVGHVTFSFGAHCGSRSARKADKELPSVAFPLFQCVDQFVATPAGQPPPVLGSSDFGESLEARRRRRRTPLGQERYELDVTYSFHFHTMYVDLTRWETANLPAALNALDLASFFDAQPLRLVAYDVRPAPDGSERHLQRLKDYVFAFEVRYDKRKRLDGEDDDEDEDEDEGDQEDDEDATTPLGQADDALLASEGSTRSSTLSDASLDEDAVLTRQQAAFLRWEGARRLAQLSVSLLCWLEELDVAADVRRVLLVLVVRDKADAQDEPEAVRRPRLAIVSSDAVRGLLQRRHGRGRGQAAQEGPALRLHSRSRVGRYSSISAEVQHVATQLTLLAAEPLAESHESEDDGSEDEDEDETRVLAAQAALYRCLCLRPRLQEAGTTSATLSPSRLGVNLSLRERAALGVRCQGVVYRFYTASLLRQEVLLLARDELLLYRSYASRPDKQLSYSLVLDVRAVELPGGAPEGAFALQIRCFAQELVLCVGTASARDAWVRAVRQRSDPVANLARAQRGELDVCLALGPTLRPAERLELNSRCLFPELQPHEDALDVSTVAGALRLVTRTLERALAVLRTPRGSSVTRLLAFLDDASALRAVDVQRVQTEASHEQQLAFFLNLYHAVLAHAMLARGFPRGRGQWPRFLSRMSYVLARDVDGQRLPLSLSLAELEHVVLRARLPRAQLSHLSLTSVLETASPLVRGLGLRHPDFRLSLALATTRSSDLVPLYDPQRVHEQLNAAVRDELRRWAAHGSLQVHADGVVLPRVCEWYRRDYGEHDAGPDTARCVLRKLLGFLDEPLQQQTRALLAQDDDEPLRVSFRAFRYEPKSSLRLASDDGHA